MLAPAAFSQNPGSDGKAFRVVFPSPYRPNKINLGPWLARDPIYLHDYCAS